MKIVKNMEAVFIAAIALVAATAFATDFSSTEASQAAVATDGQIATVVVTGKRMTAAEKARAGS